MTRRRLSALAVILPLGLGWAPPALSATPTVSFDDSERLFTVEAWLNWVGDEDPDEAKDPAFPVRKQLRQHLATLPAALKAKHRRAYLQMQADSLYLRNGIFLMASGLYGEAPRFDLRLPPADYAGPAAYSLRTFGHFRLPAPALLREFHAKAGLQRFFLATYRPALKAARAGWERDALQAMADTQDLLRTPISRPVAVQVNLLGTYGIAGQTTYQPWLQRYEIKFNPAAEANTSDRAAQILRHELTHALMNDAVLAEAEGQVKLNTVAKACGWSVGAAPEWLAQSIEILGLPASAWESHARAYRNPLFWHVAESLGPYMQSGQSFRAYLPTLFRTYDVAKETRRWQSARQDEDTVDAILDKEEERGSEATRDAFAELTRRQPDNMLAWYWLGVLSWRDFRQAAPAREALNHLQQADPTLAKLPPVYRPWFHYWQASIAKAEGRQADAIAAWRRVRALAPDDDLGKEAAEALKQLGETP